MSPTGPKLYPIRPRHLDIQRPLRPCSRQSRRSRSSRSFTPWLCGPAPMSQISPEARMPSTWPSQQRTPRRLLRCLARRRRHRPPTRLYLSPLPNSSFKMAQKSRLRRPRSRSAARRRRISMRNGAAGLQSSRRAARTTASARSQPVARR